MPFKTDKILTVRKYSLLDISNLSPKPETKTFFKKPLFSNNDAQCTFGFQIIVKM